MQDIPLNINFIAAVIFIGVFLGFFLSYFYIRKSWRQSLPNLIMGFFILALTLTMLEGWMNYTMLIFKFLSITNFAEPFNFIIAPLLYLFVVSQFKDVKKPVYWLHFTPFIIWTLYCVFFFIQPDAVKYNSNIEVMQLDIPYIYTTQLISDSPLGIRHYVNVLTGASFIIYISLIVRLLIIKSRELNQNLWKTNNKTLMALRNSLYHFLAIIAIFVIVKLIFKNDVGDYFIYLYLSFMLFMATVQIMNSSNYYEEVSSFLEGPVLKYQKSSLLDDQKNDILEAIISQMKSEKYYKSSTASLSGLSKAIHQSSHHVSQVINEKLDQSFFEMLASFRVEEAKAILKTDLGKKLTIEDIAERVGYNSKSAFNTAFKKFTSQTPSAYRDS
ncbi:MAG: helix-turn-helix domain-containing protein [Psychroserpens sp.]|uniref:helix-turn-helix domain-containing protein n=1 Tax=Psychroserpens sp. TaxID=2020870 RepID=UPI0030036754